MRRPLLLAVLFSALSWTEDSLPKPEIPDPFGLGERLALIDYLRDEMNVQPPEGANVEELTRLYWDKKASAPKDGEQAASEDRSRRMRFELKERFGIDAPTESGEDELRQLLAAAKTNSLDRTLAEVREKASLREHPLSDEEAERIAGIERDNATADMQRIAGDIRVERATMEALDKKRAKIAADLKNGQTQLIALSAAANTAKQDYDRATAKYTQEMQANGKVSNETKIASNKAQASYNEALDAYNAALAQLEKLTESDTDIVKQLERIAKRIQQLDAQNSELADKSHGPVATTAAFPDVQGPQEAPPPVKDLEGLLKAAVVLVFVEGRGSGTGFFISSDGLLITNAHVIGEKELPMVALWDNSAKRKPTKLHLVKKDADKDLALLRADGGSFTTLSMREVYDLSHQVMAVGFPLAGSISEELGTSPTDIVVSKGILSAVRRQAEKPEWLQHDCKIASGNSGGPLIDQSTGEVVGINTMVLTPDASGGAGDSMSFAIPIVKVKETFGALLK